MMYHIPAVLAPEEVANFSSLLQQAEWIDGRAPASSQGETVKNSQQPSKQTGRGSGGGRM